jgi:serine/threonine protein kinase
LLNDEHLKIGDLGVSKSIETIANNLSKFPGTLSYMSPEIVNNEPNYTTKIHIWSSACLIFELSTLAKLFDDTNEHRIKAKILNQPINFHEEIDSDLKQILNG